MNMSQDTDITDEWEDSSDSNEPVDEANESQGRKPDSIEDENGVSVHQPSEELEQLTTYEAEIGGTKYHVTPVITNTGVRWDLNIYGRRQGPIRPDRDGVTDEQAAHLGLSPREQQELNRALKIAKENFDLPKSLRGQKHRNRPMDELLNAEVESVSSDD